MQESKTERFPGVEDVIGDFTWYMNRHQGILPKKTFERRMEYSDEVMPELLQQVHQQLEQRWWRWNQKHTGRGGERRAAQKQTG